MTTADLVAALRRFALLEPARLDKLTRALQGRADEPPAVARKLVEHGWLTPFQAEKLLQGRGQELVFGPYLLLEPLGEGSMGIVYKARHQRMDRVVALKVIRKERLHNREVVQRFQREVRAASQLSHPNVVVAFDADQANGLHYLAMEYVEGTDLGRLVSRQGPLPVAESWEYVRQAALGLQHAFERGIVHRDIKPQNLLLTRQLGAAASGTIKVLDLGLARLAAPGAVDEATLTQPGSVMGTPDYMAPEQILGAHDVDIRADLYSLGCTFYFLLTGRVPFPGTELGIKLVQHQTAEPTPVEQLRPEVPSAVAAVVRKLMAKRPEDRFPTPAALAAVLAGGPPATTGAQQVVLAAEEAAHDAATIITPAPEPPRRQRGWLVAALVGSVLALAGLALLLARGS